MKIVAIRMNIANNRERRARRCSLEGRRNSRHEGRYMGCRFRLRVDVLSCYNQSFMFEKALLCVAVDSAMSVRKGRRG